MRTESSTEAPEDRGRRALARSLVASWERQQEAYIPHRDIRFDLMMDLVERLSPSGPDRPRILDLACGPGSLSARVLDRFPHADVVAVDLDPLLLTLGRLDHADAAISAGAEDWETWWSAVRATPELAEEVVEHDATFTDKALGDAPSLDLHLRALRDSGFAEVELVWHDLTEGLLCALKTGSTSPARDAGGTTG